MRSLPPEYRFFANSKIRQIYTMAAVKLNDQVSIPVVSSMPKFNTTMRLTIY